MMMGGGERPYAFASSADGISFEFEASMDSTFPVGSFVEVDTGPGTKKLGQILTLGIGTKSPAKVWRDGMMPLSELAVEVPTSDPAIRGSGQLLHRRNKEADNVADNEAVKGFERAAMTAAANSVVGDYLKWVKDGRHKALEVGVALCTNPEAPVHVQAAGFAKHTMLCGQSGSGKTYGLGRLVEQLMLQTKIRIVIIDPNSDFSHLHELADDLGKKAGNPACGGMAYPDLVAKHADLCPDIARYTLAPDAPGGAKPLRLLLSDVPTDALPALLRLDPASDTTKFAQLRAILTRFEGKKTTAGALDQAIRSSTDSAAHHIRNIGLLSWPVWSDDQTSSCLDGLDHHRVCVYDIGSLGSQEEQWLVSVALLQRLWSARTKREPVLVVVDEAHTVCSATPSGPLAAMATDKMVQIAGEGRKYGLYLLAATQRPGKVHESLISQCDNLALMRMTSSSDLDRVQAMCSYAPAGMARQAARFSKGEVLLAGSFVNCPVLAKFGGRWTKQGGTDVGLDWICGPQSVRTDD